jgi:hypothetical protein
MVMAMAIAMAMAIVMAIVMAIHLVLSDIRGFEAQITSSVRCSTMQSDIARGRWQTADGKR